MSVPANTFARLLEGILLVPAGIVTALFLTKLASNGLLRSYWALGAWLALNVAEQALRLIYSNVEVPVYRAGHALKLVLAGVLLWRLCRLVFVNYPAIGSFAARALQIVIPLCIALGIVSFITDHNTPEGRSERLQLVVAAARAATTALLGFLLLLGVFAGWFPVRMKRNIGRILIGMLVLLGFDWINMLLGNSNLSQAALWAANAILSLASVCVAAYWLVTLGPAGEEAAASAIPRWDPKELDRMTKQLEQMQVQLSRRGYD